MEFTSTLFLQMSDGSHRCHSWPYPVSDSQVHAEIKGYDFVRSKSIIRAVVFRGSEEPTIIKLKEQAV